MFFADLARMIAGLAVTLGLIGLIVVGMRRFGPETLKRFQGIRPARRLAVVETLILDPGRRLVLVRVDREERLILLGEGRLLASQPVSSPPPSDPSAPEPAQ